MNFTTANYDRIDEKMYEYVHRSGLKAFVIPKRGYFKKNASIATHYGSINNEFIIPGNSSPDKVPDGIAHFLEHKLFEQKDGNVMEKFGKLGASPNAYTGFNHTVYFFSATDRFTESLELLLDFVQNPHITEESVEKEKGIIGQEIRMYQDNPGWRVFFNLLNAMYKKNPVRVEIAGTLESIANIDRDTLYKCYRTFYHPSNMILLVTGNVEPERVFEMLDRHIPAMEQTGEIERIFPEREKKVSRNYTEQALSVASPLFQLGFMNNPDFEEPLELATHETAVKILLDMFLGRSSQLYNELYNQGLINSTFDMDYMCEENYAFSILGGESRDPGQMRDRIVEYLRKLKDEGIDRNDFERSKRAMFGRFVRQFNSVDKISHGFISVYFKGVNLFDYFDVYDKIDFGYITDVFKGHFDLDNLVLSVIKPIQGG